MTKIRTLLTPGHALGLAFVATLATLLPFSAAQAYVGPGLSAGAVAVVLGVIGSVFLAIFAIIWYPLKRLMKKGKPSPEATQSGGQES